MSTKSPVLMPRASASTVLMKHSWGKASRSETTLSFTVWARRRECGVHSSSGNSSVWVPAPCSGSAICHFAMGESVEKPREFTVAARPME